MLQYKVKGKETHTMLKKILITLFVIILSGSVFAHEYKLGTLEIDHPYTRATAAGAKVGGAFMTINNRGSQPDKLVSVTGAAFAGKVELHETKMINNVMEMRELKQGLVIPAKGKIELKPGSYHVMFMDLKEPLVKGKKYKAKLNFEKAGSIEVEFDAMEAKEQRKH
jgi:copper(I)-binding protein